MGKMRTIASRRSISSIFQRKGGEGRLTMLFDHLPDFERRALESWGVAYDRQLIVS